MLREKIAEVFKTIGQPTVTYVRRDSGELENRLNSALNESGQLCLVTGPSKTGKTTLYREVLKSRNQIPLIVQCNRTKRCRDIWCEALEAVEFSRVTETSRGGGAEFSAAAEAGGDIGWAWLAKASGKATLSAAKTLSEEECRARILADPGPELLIPVLKNTNYVLVIEDFHYLDDDEKVLLFQQWKRFVDNEVSVLVLGTTHRAVDIANSNKDLVGRISQVDVGHWSNEDLGQIVVKGFKHLKIPLQPSVTAILAPEAVGLPIIVQQVCHNLFSSREIEYADQIKRGKFSLDESDVRKCLHNVARNKYTQFESYYNTIISGPREKARKYRTYELVLACFTLDPIKFSLKRRDIDDRLSRLEVLPEEKPPAASLNSTLGALKKFQENRNIELLEWRPNEDKLYIIEPSFLFYVRWRTLKEERFEQLDMFEFLLKSTSQNSSLKIQPKLIRWHYPRVRASSGQKGETES